MKTLSKIWFVVSLVMILGMVESSNFYTIIAVIANFIVATFIAKWYDKEFFNAE